MRIASFTHDSIVDGPGLRFVVFVQGCSRNCPGCHNPDTHDPHGGREVYVRELLAEIKKNPLIKGLTISGGEPLDQALDCARLAWQAKKLDLDVWVYTGYRYEDVEEARLPEWDALLEWTDVLVDGPFVEGLKTYDAKFMGSINQRLVDVQKSLEAGRVVLWHSELGCEQLKFEVPES